MRNVPMGAGRRKSKHSNSQYRNIVILSDGFQSFQSDALKSTHHRPLPCASSTPSQPLLSKGTVLKSDQEDPLYESVTCAFNIREQGNNAASGSMICGYKREEPSCSSSAIASNLSKMCLLKMQFMCDQVACEFTVMDQHLCLICSIILGFHGLTHGVRHGTVSLPWKLVDAHLNILAQWRMAIQVRFHGVPEH